MNYPLLAEVRPEELRRLMASYRTDANGCWVWATAITTTGYGHFHWHNAYYQAHRFMYGLLVAPVPAGLTIDHLCRNRACVNPAHMEPVTPAENSRRGRSTKLRPDEVEAIRAELSAGYGVRQIARARGIHYATVSRIGTGRLWRAAA